MNRLDDLILTMPDRIANANSSPPVNIHVLDYNSTDGLDKWIDELIHTTWLATGNSLSYLKYDKRNYFHSTHSYNLAMLTGEGEWVVLTPADVFVRDGYIKALRERIAEGCQWCNTDRKRRSTIAIAKDEFIKAGGYDERVGTFFEERRMEQTYGEAYREYRRRVPLFLPLRGRATAPGRRRG